MQPKFNLVYKLAANRALRIQKKEKLSAQEGLNLYMHILDTMLYEVKQALQAQGA